MDRRLHFRVDNGKANMTPPSAANWYKFISVDIPNGDNVGVVTEWVYPAETVTEIPDAICTQIQTDIAKKEYRAAAQSPDWVGYLVARILKIDVSKKPGKAAVGRTLETLYNKNVITAADGETGRHKVKIVIAGPWRPTMTPRKRANTTQRLHQRRGCECLFRRPSHIRQSACECLYPYRGRHSFALFSHIRSTPGQFVSGVAGTICKCDDTTCGWYTAGSG